VLFAAGFLRLFLLNKYRLIQLLQSNRKSLVCRSYGGLAAFTKQEKSFSLPLIRRFRLLLQSNRKSLVCRSCRGWQLLLPVTAKVTKNALGERRQNLSAQVTAQPQPSRSKRSQTRRRSNSEAVLPRCGATARHTPEALGTPRDESADAGAIQAGRKIYCSLIIRRPTPQKRQPFIGCLFVIPSVHNIHFCDFGVRPGRDNCDLTGVYDDLRVWEAVNKG
jgi:hypothetical protein